MSPELTDKLNNKFPQIFPEHFYFEVHDGWYTLIEELCRLIQLHIDRSNVTPTFIEGFTPNPINQVIATQIKEKFGGLRFYYDGGNDAIAAAVELTENLSYRICELCGSPGTQNTTGWIKTRCPTCTKKA